MMTHAAMAAPAMALAGITPLSAAVCAPEFTPFGAAATTTGPEGVELGLVDRVPVGVGVEVAVPVPVRGTVFDSKLIINYDSRQR
jgi:hypothetical protein